MHFEALFGAAAVRYASVDAGFQGPWNRLCPAVCYVPAGHGDVLLDIQIQPSCRLTLSVTSVF
jgi:hypothetical protein